MMSELLFDQLVREYHINRKRREAMTQWELLHNDEHKGFQIRVFVAPECDISPEEQLCAPEDVQAVYDGLLEWFRVRVVAYKRDIPLGDDYLGGCCYHAARDFIQDAYYTHMCDEAVREAESALAALAQE
jgi:hypothetical protein